MTETEPDCRVVGESLVEGTIFTENGVAEAARRRVSSTVPGEVDYAMWYVSGFPTQAYEEPESNGWTFHTDPFDSNKDWLETPGTNFSLQGDIITGRLLESDTPEAEQLRRGLKEYHIQHIDRSPGNG